MKYFFTLLLIIALCTCGRAQLQITASLAPVEDFCSGANPDPNADCINVPAGNDNLTYLPGQDGDLLFTYRIINQSGKFIRQVLATDSRFGTFFPTQTLANNIPPGATVPLNVIYDALTAPELVNGVVTLTVEYANGSSEQVTGAYTLDVVAPEVTTQFSLVRKLDACPDDVIAPECGTTNYGNLIVSVGATDTVVTRFNWTNTGESTLTESVLTDQDGNILAQTGFDMEPGQTLISAQYIVAPALPGTYSRFQELVTTDFAGNTYRARINYTIIVEAPQLETAFSLVRKLDACPNDVIAPECGTTNYGNFTITVGATDTVVTRFDWENAGLGTFDESLLVDQDGEELASTGFNQVTGQRLISARYIVAPAEVGTHTFSQTITVTDFGGNTATETITYTIIVEAPQLETAFSLVRKLDACPNDVIAPECGTTNYGNFTITVGATDTVVTRFDWENAGLGTFDESLLVDQDGEELAGTGFNQVTGQRLISARYIVAPAEVGTHTFSQTITVTDFGGNTATETISYTIIVEAPQLETAFSLIRKKDACTTDVIAPECGVTSYGTLQLEVGAGDTILTRFDWENAGLGTFDMSELVTQDGEVLASTGFNQVTGQRLISARYLVSPGEPGIYNWSQTVTVTDFGGNTATETINYEIKVNCDILDDAPPVARCRNRTVTVVEGETVSINAGTINDDSYDGCGDLAGGAIDINSFTCADEGPNTVTLTVGDPVGNTASCTATVTVNVESAVYEPALSSCETDVVPVTAGQNWNRIELNGKLVAEVIVGGNLNVKNMRVSVAQAASLTESSLAPVLGKRIELTPLDGNEVETQPGTEPFYVRLYYTAAEIDALLAADPAASESTLTLIKTDDAACGGQYTGLNRAEMNSSPEHTGCTGNDRYFEFFTGSFSTFFLFSTDATLPVELTEFTAGALPKQRVRLDWTTALETANSHFEVERSSDGRSFVQLGAVAGAGESTQEQAYAFLDENVPAGTQYYRLRQVDLDGTETLSEVRVVTVVDAISLEVYPNPAISELRLTGFSGGTVHLLDANGRTLRRQYLEEGQPLPVAALPPGLYLLRAGEATIRWVKR